MVVLVLVLVQRKQAAVTGENERFSWEGEGLGSLVFLGSKSCDPGVVDNQYPNRVMSTEIFWVLCYGEARGIDAVVERGRKRKEKGGRKRKEKEGRKSSGLTVVAVAVAVAVAVPENIKKDKE
ncbi:hypothetical protein SLE2022_116640 [Rubroshorea leprosula]